MHAGTLNSRQLAEQSLRRFEQIDRSRPRLCAVIETNPDALALADALDNARITKKNRGALQGFKEALMR